jgi:hypothetical protein
MGSPELDTELVDVTRVNGTPPPDIALADADLGSWDFWGLDDDVRDGAFATLRREAPVRFFEAFMAEGPDGDTEVAGHWALTRYDDIPTSSARPAAS